MDGKLSPRFPRVACNQQAIARLAVSAFCLVALAGENLNAAQNTNPIMDIGIVQRFGENPRDRLTIEAVDGDVLSVTFDRGDGKAKQTLTTNKLILEIAKQSLPVPVTEEKIVLSNHRSYENAAASAHRWAQLGIETEIAQPRRWQVWAKRSTYDSPLLRRLLTFSLRVQGHRLVRLESVVRREKPLVSWVAGNFRYSRDRLDIQSKRGVFEVNDRLYAGTLRVQPNAYNSFTLVNSVPLETYLRGVVPHEIGYGAPYAAVQAQAVLARTYALASRQRFAVDNYHLCADTQCQVYRGLEAPSELADRAIADTRGKVLTYNGKVIEALYSSTTGGVTANYNDLWDGTERPYLQSVVDSVRPPFDLQRSDLGDERRFRAFLAQKDGFNEKGWDTFRWQADSSLSEIEGTLRQFLRLAGDHETRFSRIESMQIVDRAPSGRVREIAVNTDTGTISLHKDEIMDALYAPNSTLFAIEPLYGAALKGEDGKATAAPPLKGYRFIGGGLGHGVGMSQTGSYYLGKLGWSYDRILNFYYTDAKLQPFRPEFLPAPSLQAAAAPTPATRPPE